MGRIALFALVLAACQDAGPSLSQTQQLAVVLSPASKDFGSLQVGQMSPYAPLTVNPAIGEQDDYITNIYSTCPDFMIDAPGLPAHVYRICTTSCDPQICVAPQLCQSSEYQGYTFSAAFRPTIAGSVSCVVNIELNNSTLRTVTLSGTTQICGSQDVVQIR